MNNLSREAVNNPFLETFKTKTDGALGLDLVTDLLVGNPTHGRRGEIK